MEHNMSYSKEYPKILWTARIKYSVLLADGSREVGIAVVRFYFHEIDPNRELNTDEFLKRMQEIRIKEFFDIDTSAILSSQLEYSSLSDGMFYSAPLDDVSRPKWECEFSQRLTPNHQVK